ncbi:MAG TPA: DUF4197 domain-containing protein [Flavisolibacter sp.]|jgi:hypothetical protein|nr:DUF4197 domain-containing protein [Flavisolibacter sp.]
MKRLFVPILLALLLPLTYSCSSSRLAGYTLNEQDAAAAIREMLSLGARDGLANGAFSKEMIMSTLFPEPVRKTLNTLNQLGLTNEIDRFTTTLSTAAQKTATSSIPIFVSGINSMRLTDAMRIIKNGGTSATDYLRSSVGDSLRKSIRPAMQAALDEYKLNQQWENIIKPAKSLSGDRFNLDLANLMAGAVSEAMFQKLEEKEKQVRTDANARTTNLLQKVFSRNWN